MLRTILGCHRTPFPTCLTRLNSSLSYKPTLRTEVETDENAITIRPTWSVNELLSSYPRPAISPATLKHLHALSALIPLEEGFPERAKLTKEMQDLVKLVEAVRFVDTDSVCDENDVPDGRIWAEGTGIDLNAEPIPGTRMRFRAVVSSSAPRMSPQKGCTSSIPTGRSE